MQHALAAATHRGGPNASPDFFLPATEFERSGHEIAEVVHQNNFRLLTAFRVAMTKRVFALIAVNLLLAGPTLAGPLEDGRAAYERGDHATALLLWKPLAEDGDASAQFHVGVMYENGRGVPQRFVEAVKWYWLSAKQGNAQAQFNLGVMFDEGRGGARDLLEAQKWYRLAAEQGAAKAQFNLAVMYASGEARDYAEAIKWCRRAAEQGDTEAQGLLGIMHGLGRGVEQDLVTAHKWLSLAVARGEKKAEKSRDLIAKEMTFEQLAEAQRLAEQWKLTPED